MFAIKRAAERFLAGSGLADMARRRRRSQALVLAYHNVVSEPPVSADPSLHLTRKRFAAQLDELGKTHDIVDLRTATEEVSGGSRPRVAITFDDAYRGAIEAGLDELHRRDLPATVFVAPGILGDRAMWWDQLDPAGNGWDERSRETALQRWRGDDESIRDWAGRSGFRRREPGREERTVSESELDRVVGGAFTVASHSWSHVNLAAVDGETLARELRESRRWLEDRYGSAALPYVAYPYGRFGPDVEREVSRAGYRFGFGVTGGWIAGPELEGRTTLPRLNVPASVTPAGFTVRVAGLLN